MGAVSFREVIGALFAGLVFWAPPAKVFVCEVTTAVAGVADAGFDSSPLLDKGSASRKQCAFCPLGELAWLSVHLRRLHLVNVLAGSSSSSLLFERGSSCSPAWAIALRAVSFCEVVVAPFAGLAFRAPPAKAFVCEVAPAVAGVAVGGLASSPLLDKGSASRKQCPSCFRGELALLSVHLRRLPISNVLAGVASSSLLLERGSSCRPAGAFALRVVSFCEVVGALFAGLAFRAPPAASYVSEVAPAAPGVAAVDFASSPLLDKGSACRKQCAFLLGAPSPLGLGLRSCAVEPEALGRWGALLVVSPPLDEALSSSILLAPPIFSNDGNLPTCSH